MFAALFATASLAFAQSPTAAPKAPATTSSPATSTTTTTTSSPATTTTSAMPSDAEMMKKMMELSKLNDNHKLLASMAGTWSYTVKMMMDPNAKPSESTGTAVRKSIMDGRYLTGDYTGSFKMPGPDGKMQTMNFHGMSIDAYDNVKQKFTNAWIDNMGTGIMMTEGTYDVATKTFTFTGSFEEMPGMTTKVREVIKMTDKDHMTMEFYNDRGTGETKGMEISYTRKK
jgi:Protein of unknown function (DUF1579)